MSVAVILRCFAMDMHDTVEETLKRLHGQLCFPCRRAGGSAAQRHPGFARPLGTAKGVKSTVNGAACPCMLAGVRAARPGGAITDLSEHCSAAIA